MRLPDAVHMFGFTGRSYTLEQVKGRFAVLARDNHPDMQQAPGANRFDMAKLVEARDILIANHAGDTACIQCNGVGSIKGRACGKCHGDGVV